MKFGLVLSNLRFSVEDLSYGWVIQKVNFAGTVYTPASTKVTEVCNGVTATYYSTTLHAIFEI